MKSDLARHIMNGMDNTWTSTTKWQVRSCMRLVLTKPDEERKTDSFPYKTEYANNMEKSGEQ